MNRTRLSRPTALLAASLLVTLGGQAGTASASGPVPSHFEPASASFVSGDVGFVLGTAPCAHAPCTSLVATYDGGQSWVGLPAPKAPLGEVSSGRALAVSQVTFANARDGWSWGPALWSTHDGGATWSQPVLPVPAPGGPADLLSLQVSGGYAYALVASWSERGSGSSAALLERSPVGLDGWAALTSISGSLSGMTWYGRTGWVVKTAHPGSGPEQIWRTTDAGATWARLPDPCYQPAQGLDLAGLATPDGAHLFELCAGNPGAGSEAKQLMVSANGGLTAHLAGRLPLGGLVSGMAAASPEELVVAASSGAGFLYRSSDGGRTWSTKMLDDGGAGLSDLAFPAFSLGVVVDGRPGERGQFPDRLLITTSGGYSWGTLRVNPPTAALFGPGAVWAEARHYQGTAAQACGYYSSGPVPPQALTACTRRFMLAHGASAAAVAYFDATGSYLVGFVSTGRVDVGYTLTVGPMDCGCFGYVLLNGQYQGISPPGPTLTGAAYASLRKAYRGLQLDPDSPPFVESAKLLPGGGEEIVFQFPLNSSCAACATPYRAPVMYMLSPSGAYLGSTSYGPCLGTPAPTGGAAQKVKVSAPACPKPLASPPV